MLFVILIFLFFLLFVFLYLISEDKYDQKPKMSLKEEEKYDLLKSSFDDDE